MAIYLWETMSGKTVLAALTHINVNTNNKKTNKFVDAF